MQNIQIREEEIEKTTAVIKNDTSFVFDGIL